MTTTTITLLVIVSCCCCSAITCPNYGHYYDKVTKIQTDAFCPKGEYCETIWKDLQSATRTRLATTRTSRQSNKQQSTCKPYASLVNSFDACLPESDYRNAVQQFNYPASLMYKGKEGKNGFFPKNGQDSIKCTCGTELCDPGEVCTVVYDETSAYNRTSKCLCPTSTKDRSLQKPFQEGVRNLYTSSSDRCTCGRAQCAPGGESGYCMFSSYANNAAQYDIYRTNVSGVQSFQTTRQTRAAANVGPVPICSGLPQCQYGKGANVTNEAFRIKSPCYCGSPNDFFRDGNNVLENGTTILICSDPASFCQPSVTLSRNSDCKSSHFFSLSCCHASVISVFNSHQRSLLFLLLLLLLQCM